MPSSNAQERNSHEMLADGAMHPQQVAAQGHQQVPSFAQFTLQQQQVWQHNLQQLRRQQQMQQRTDNHYVAQPQQMYMQLTQQVGVPQAGMWGYSQVPYWKPGTPVMLPQTAYPVGPLIGVAPVVWPQQVVVAAAPYRPDLVGRQGQPPSNGFKPERQKQTSSGSKHRKSSLKGNSSSDLDTASRNGDAASISSPNPGSASRQSSSGLSPCLGAENQGWAWLVDGILQQVVQHLAAHVSLKAFRLTCKHWKNVADQNIEALSPSSLRPKELVLLFPRLQVTLASALSVS